jgi:oligopeptidase A
MSADIFGAFEEADLDDNDAVAALGRRCRDTLLALGGSVPPMEVFEMFRGRAPQVDALLRQSGLKGKGN